MGSYESLPNSFSKYASGSWNVLSPQDLLNCELLVLDEGNEYAFLSLPLSFGDVVDSPTAEKGTVRLPFVEMC